jgi:putative transposase
VATVVRVVDRYGWICHAYVVMHNHFHLLVETPLPNLSLGMRQLNGLYAQWFNRRHNRSGHVF